MCRGDEGLSGIMTSMSKGAGTCVGTVAAAGKRIAGVVVGGVVAVGCLLARPVETPELSAEEQTESTSEGFGIGAGDEQETEQKKSVKSQISALESDLTVAKNKPDKFVQEDQGVKPQPSFVLSSVQSRYAGSLPTPLEEVVVGAAEAKSGSSIGIHRKSRTNEKAIVRTEAQPFEVEGSGFGAISDEEVRSAVFDTESQRIIFRRALCDISNQSQAVRADAVKTIAGIGHDLSVRVLVNQMSRDPSAQVRQECVKALTTLQRTEGLSAVEVALSDRAALVRLTAVWGLYRMAGAESGPALVGMFSDESAEVRRRAVTCVSWLGQEQLAVELLPLLEDSSFLVRLAAVEAMGTLRCRRGVAALIEHLNDPEKAVRKAILGALGTITGKKMSGPFPRDNRSLERLIARWREWWKEEQRG